ncbi:MAG: nucleotidyltransferase domain-containing protein [Calditrichaeota bacterium]|nr:nucleotidyltransferase domain-containing protein [Calditrichota bacterium]
MSPNLNQRLLDVADRACEEFRQDPRVDAIMLTGSAAIGCTDMGSDLDLILYLNAPHSEEEFEEQKRRAVESGGGFYFGSAEHGYGVYRRIEGVKVDFGFGGSVETDALIQSVLEEHSTEAVSHQVLAGILEALPMHGEQRIRDWQNRLLPMPEALQLKLLRENLRMTPLAILESMGAARGDRPFYCETVLQLQTRLLKLIYALDGRYYPGKLKGIQYRMDGLSLGQGLHERFCRQLSGPMDEGVLDLGRLIPEILTHVHQRFPAIDISSALEFFSSDSRIQWA